MATSIIQQPEQPIGALWWKALLHAYPPLASVPAADLPGASLAVRLLSLNAFNQTDEVRARIEADLATLFPLLHFSEVHAAERLYIQRGESTVRAMDDLLDPARLHNPAMLAPRNASLAVAAGWYTHKGEVLGGVLHLYRPGERQRPRLWDVTRPLTRTAPLLSRLEPAVLVRSSAPSELEAAARQVLTRIGLPRGVDNPAEVRVVNQITVPPSYAGTVDERLLNQIFTQVSALPYAVNALPERASSEGVCAHALVLQQTHQSLHLVAHALGGTWRYRQPTRLYDVLAEAVPLLPAVIGLVLSYWRLSRNAGLEIDAHISWMDAGTLHTIISESIAEAAYAWRVLPNGKMEG